MSERASLTVLVAGPYRSGLARERGLGVFHRLRDVPGCESMAEPSP